MTAAPGAASADTYDPDLSSPLTPLPSSPSSSSPRAKRAPSSSPPATAAKRSRMRTPSSSLPIPPSFTTGEQADPLNANYRVWSVMEDDRLWALRGEQGRSFEEIAAMMGRSATAVSIRFYALKRRAREGDALGAEEGVKSEPPEGGGADALPLPPGDGAGGPVPSTSAAAPVPAPALAPVPAAAPPAPAPAPAPAGGPSSSSNAPRKVRRYTSAEDLLVASYRREGLSAAAIGEKLGRSTNSIYNRLTALDSMGMDVTPRKKAPAPDQAKGKAGDAQ
ncbi:hypothetical protein JCM10450v2_007894 [Rhodotorula kratochvilovae]